MADSKNTNTSNKTKTWLSITFAALAAINFTKCSLSNADTDNPTQKNDNTELSIKNPAPSAD